MSLLPEFELGLWNAWIFMVWYLVAYFYIFMFIKNIKKRGMPSELPYRKIEKIFAYYIATPLWFISVLCTIFLPLKLGTIWFYIGVLIYLVGIIIYTIADIKFATTPLDEPVTKGIYSISRHPIYVAHDFIFIGIGIACASWFFLLISIIFLIGQHISAFAEERFCIEKHGESYHEYMNRVPRYIGIPKSRK